MRDPGYDHYYRTYSFHRSGFRGRSRDGGSSVKIARDDLGAALQLLMTCSLGTFVGQKRTGPGVETPGPVVNLFSETAQSYLRCLAGIIHEAVKELSAVQR